MVLCVVVVFVYRSKCLDRKMLRKSPSFDTRRVIEEAITNNSQVTNMGTIRAMMYFF